MLRGAQKQMIVVRTHDSRVFEEAYFVVRGQKRGDTAPMPDKEDMLTEAGRILARSLHAAGDSPASLYAGRGGSRARAAGIREAETLPDGMGMRGDASAGESRTGRLRRRLMAAAWFMGGLLCGGGTVGLFWLLA